MRDYKDDDMSALAGILLGMGFFFVLFIVMYYLAGGCS